MWYNKKMFADNSLEVPTTYEDFKTVCETFIANGIQPIGSSVKDTWVLAMLHDALTLKSAGPEKVKNALTKNGVSVQVKAMNMMTKVTSLTGAVQDIYQGDCRVSTFDGMPEIVTGKVDAKDAEIGRAHV